ncbi:hypothetical protein [Rickettsia hoogstraalii]|uniref:hypothetical protein n=1 Tax=Rickettsia hoogstraalii TaxID=467174 RepID=UPI0012E03CDB|nr:hypothetical protein [Rickettsia hoogstraalii]
MFLFCCLVIASGHCCMDGFSVIARRITQVIRRSNPVKNSDLQNFFIIYPRLPRRFAPRKALLRGSISPLSSRGLTTGSS